MVRWLIVFLLACVASWGQSEPSQADPKRKALDNALKGFDLPGTARIFDNRLIQTAENGTSVCTIPMPGMYLLRPTPDDSMIRKAPGADKVDPVQRRLPHPICKWSR